MFTTLRRVVQRTRWPSRLWVPESGTGGAVHLETVGGRRNTVVNLPGFTRGLALDGSYAFVGQSRIRPTSATDAVPLAEWRDELWCGVAAVALRSGRVAGWLDFQTAVEEIFDVQLVPGAVPRGGRVPEKGRGPHVRCAAGCRPVIHSGPRLTIPRRAAA